MVGNQTRNSRILAGISCEKLKSGTFTDNVDFPWRHHPTKCFKVRIVQTESGTHFNFPAVLPLLAPIEFSNLLYRRLHAFPSRKTIKNIS